MNIYIKRILGLFIVFMLLLQPLNLIAEQEMTLKSVIPCDNNPLFLYVDNPYSKFPAVHCYDTDLVSDSVYTIMDMKVKYLEDSDYNYEYKYGVARWILNFYDKKEWYVSIYDSGYVYVSDCPDRLSLIDTKPVAYVLDNEMLRNLIYYDCSQNEIVDNVWKNNYVTRGDAIAYTMLVLGVPQNFDILNYVDWRYVIPYCDFEHDDKIDDAFLMLNHVTKNQAAHNPDFVDAAIVLAGIANGYKICHEDGHEKTYFGYSQYVRVSEAVAFMVRCLGEYGEQTKNLQHSFELGKSLGLITESDEFYYNPDSCITFEQFGVLLERFVNQKMYLYFDDATSGNFEKTVNSAKTYRSYLTDKFGSVYVDNLLKLNGF